MIGLALVIVWSVIISIFLFSWYAGISPTPSSGRVKTLFNKKLSVQAGTILELGAGWGGMATHLARTYPHKKVIAYEISPIPYFFAKVRSFYHPNLTVKRKDFFLDSHKGATLIYCYLYRNGMAQLKEKWENEQLKECSIYTNTFAVPGWEATKVWKLDDLFRTEVFCYEIG
jgi:hypothetical protein